MQVVDGEWRKPPRPPLLSTEGGIARASWRFCAGHLERLPIYAAMCRVNDFELTAELWCVIESVENPIEE